MAASRTATARLLTGASAVALALAGTVVVASPATAAALTASTELDLVNAINTANLDVAPDTITLGANITLTADLPDITEDLEIIGGGYSIDGAGWQAFRGLGATNINLTFTGVSVTNAMYGVNADFSNVTITDSTFDNAPVEIDGTTITVTVTNSTFNNASGDDGLFLEAIDSSVVSVSGSTANGNDSDGFDLNVEIDSTLIVTDCVADNNGDNGLELRAEAASAATVTGSSADSNGGDGFALDSDIGSSITVTNGSATGNAEGGFDADAADSSSITISGSTATGNTEDALYAQSWDGSTVSASDSVFSSSTAGLGIYAELGSDSTITLSRVTVEGNSYGGVYVDDGGAPGGQNTLTISESTLADNTGSGLMVSNVYYTDVVVDGSTISGNDFVVGGGIFAELYADSSLTVSNSTVSGNTQMLLGGIFVTPSTEATTSVTINSSTIVNNASSLASTVGGVYVGAGQFAISNSILAGNTSDGDPADFELNTTAPVPTGAIDYSLVQAPLPSGLVAVDAGTGNLKNVSPLLGPLANNGGVTLTHLPQDSSPVVNAGNPSTTTPALDQRGQSRVVSTTDMGAVELQLALAVTGSDAALPLAGGAALLLAAGGLLVLYRRLRTAH